MGMVPYTTSGNVKEMCKFHEHWKCTGISVHLLGISEYLKCSFFFLWIDLDKSAERTLLWMNTAKQGCCIA